MGHFAKESLESVKIGVAASLLNVLSEIPSFKCFEEKYLFLDADGTQYESVEHKTFTKT